jgi:hypothetical protein
VGNIVVEGRIANVVLGGKEVKYFVISGIYVKR